MLLITDGAPTEWDTWKQAKEQIHDMVSRHKLSFFTIGVEGADQEILSALAPKEFTPIWLKDLQFSELFKWLSASVRRVSVGKLGSEMMKLPASEGWVCP